MKKKIFNDLNLSSEVQYNIHLGQKTASVYIDPVESDEGFMYFSRSVFDSLLLYSNANLNIWKMDNDVFLGPVVGIFVNPRYLQSIKENYPPLSAVKNMQANDAAKCLIYYFTIDHIDWIDKKIKGFVYLSDVGKWKYYWFPMADVIYDRAVNFNPEEKPLVAEIRDKFVNDFHLKQINSRQYLGKWQLHKYLSRHPEIASYLPHTILYTNFNDLLMMLKLYGFIFVKSSYGSRGREVLSICLSEEGFRLNFYDDGLKELLIKNNEEIRGHVEKFIAEKQFVIQQGIKLFKFEGKNMDMRVLLEKGRDGRWEAIYNQCRIAKDTGTITNYSAGGSLINYEDIYRHMSMTHMKFRFPTFSEIEKATIRIAQFIEVEYGPFGELGMDMAFDVNGKIWFIEANTKPDKDPEPGLEDTEGVSPQFLSTLQYAEFLVRGEKNYEV